MLIAHAQNFTHINTILVFARGIVDTLFPLVVSIAVLVFIWGMALFIRASGDDKSLAEGRQKMIWGIVALFVIVSIWGLVGFLGSALGINQGGMLAPPGVADDGDPIVAPHTFE